jgi:hypothetical protein
MSELFFQLSKEDRAIVRGMMLVKLSQRPAQVFPSGRMFTFISGRAPDAPHIIGQ